MERQGIAHSKGFNTCPLFWFCPPPSSENLGLNVGNNGRSLKNQTTKTDDNAAGKCLSEGESASTTEKQRDVKGLRVKCARGVMEPRRSSSFCFFFLIFFYHFPCRGDDASETGDEGESGWNLCSAYASASVVVKFFQPLQSPRMIRVLYAGKELIFPFYVVSFLRLSLIKGQASGNFYIPVTLCM